MRTNNPTGLLMLFFVFLFSVANVSIVQGQTEKKKKTYLTFEYFKKSDGTKLLHAVLKTKVNKKFRPISSASIGFTIESDSASIFLNEIVTDNEGIAEYVIPEDIELPVGEEGYTEFKVVFAGSDTLKKKKKSLEIKDINLEMELGISDSVKTVNVTAFEINDEEGTGVSRKKVGVFVQRMFGQLKVAEGSLKNGKCEIEFPDDIPGDTLGNITVYTKIAEDDDYGTVEKMQIIDWGIPVTEKESFKRSFSGGSYLIFWIISMLVVIIIIFIAKKIKITED